MLLALEPTAEVPPGEMALGAERQPVAVRA